MFQSVNKTTTFLEDKKNGSVLEIKILILS